MSTTEETTERLRPSFDEAYEQITGHDGRAIEKAFDGISVDDLMLRLFEGRLEAPLMVLLVQVMEFVRERHAGTSDDKALAAVLDIPRKRLLEYSDAYLTEDDEVMPDEPVTESGKGDSPAA